MNSSRLPLFLTTSANDDLNQEISYLLEEAGEVIALRFAHATEETLNLIADFPHLGTPFSTETSTATDLRWRPLSGRFSKWLVFYCVTPDHIEIARILRGAAKLAVAAPVTLNSHFLAQCLKIEVWP